MTERCIVNCHVHLFTLDHVPKRFLPFGLTHALRRAPFQRTLASALRIAWPFAARDRLNRYADFLSVGGSVGQSEVFRRLEGYYPEDSRFVALPMDMAFMGAGEPPVDLHRQHDELARIAEATGGRVMPFVAVDPRRQTEGGEKLVPMIERLLERRLPGGERIFRGVKLYPPLGYRPTDPALADVWALCAERGLPVMAHCSRGGVRSRELDPEAASALADPDHYREVLDAHPGLRLCLAHFGGAGDWDRYFRDPESKREAPLDAPTRQRAHMNWLTKIKQMIESRRWDGLYTDISYTVFFIERYLPALKVLLLDPRLRARTLFGSDFYMAEQERFEERFLSMQLRAEIGETAFWEIAYDNPQRYLG